MTVLAPISWRELLDKITILEIKSEQLTSPVTIKNARHELELLSRIADGIADRGEKLAALKTALKKLNERLWNIENEIRGKEARKLFDREFVELARSVYQLNVPTVLKLLTGGRPEGRNGPGVGILTEE